MLQIQNDSFEKQKCPIPRLSFAVMHPDRPGSILSKRQTSTEEHLARRTEYFFLDFSVSRIHLQPNPSGHVRFGAYAWVCLLFLHAHLHTQTQTFAADSHTSWQSVLPFASSNLQLILSQPCGLTPVSFIRHHLSVGNGK